MLYRILETQQNPLGSSGCIQDNVTGLMEAMQQRAGEHVQAANTVPSSSLLRMLLLMVYCTCMLLLFPERNTHYFQKY